LVDEAVKKILRQEHEAHASTWRSLNAAAKAALLQIARGNQSEDDDAVASLLASEIIDFDEKDHPYIVDRNLRLWILEQNK
jgi:hypothetical protein